MRILLFLPFLLRCSNPFVHYMLNVDLVVQFLVLGLSSLATSNNARTSHDTLLFKNYKEFYTS